MLELALFRRRDFTSASFVNFFMYAALFGALFLMSQFLQTGLGNDPLQAGLQLLAWTGVSMFVAPVAGVMSDKYGTRPFIALGLLLQAAGLAWVAAIAKPGMGYGELMAALLVAGAGIGIVFPTVANAVVSSVEPDKIGIASGTSATLREVGGVFGVAVIATVFAHPGNYTSRPTFVHDFSHAMWVAAALSAFGVLVALVARGRSKAEQGPELLAAPKAVVPVGDHA
jgi:MFS family permease